MDQQMTDKCVLVGCVPLVLTFAPALVYIIISDLSCRIHSRQFSITLKLMGQKVLYHLLLLSALRLYVPCRCIGVLIGQTTNPRCSLGPGV
jgi:hypothetical protein